jgi:serine/threonine-protein kinase
MATVHIGRLLGPVGFSRTVAIKKLHPQFAKEPQFVSMFLDEARLAARIRHPNVVSTLDVIALAGELFLVMDYVQGESVARLMVAARQAGELPPLPITGAIIVGALEGLHAAHEATSEQGEPLGIVHRDVSPQNILVGTDGVPRILDFGVAKAAGRVQDTKEGQLKGKLSYMAPEQIDGVTTRATDIYAASVVLWEMLTGRRLFLADNHLQTLTNVMAANPPAPSAFAPNVSPELDLFVLRGLRKDPAERFPTARAMSRALQKVIPIATTGDVGEWVERMVGANLSSRTQKVASIEGRTSDVSLPSETTARESDGTAPAATQSILPVGVRDRPVLFVGLAAAIVLGIGTLVGVRLAAPAATPPHALPIASLPAQPSATPSARSAPGTAGTPGSSGAWTTTLPSAAPPSVPLTIVPSGASADAGAVPAVASPVRSKSDSPARSHSQGSDFSHVMDSRK